MPEGDDEDRYLIKLSEQSLQKYFSTQKIETDQQAAYRERLKIELDVIINMGFPGYFLIVADFINWAKQNNIPVGPGRGSGAGSLVAFVLGNYCARSFAA